MMTAANTGILLMASDHIAEYIGLFIAALGIGGLAARLANPKRPANSYILPPAFFIITGLIILFADGSYTNIQKEEPSRIQPVIEDTTAEMLPDTDRQMPSQEDEEIQNEGNDTEDIL